MMILRRISKSMAATSGHSHNINYPLLQNGAQRCVRLSGVAATSLDGRQAMLNYFDILGVDHTFTQSQDEMKKKYKNLMIKFHPDKHASSPREEEARNASNMATNVTRAYGVIGDPLSRALHLLELHGSAIGESDNSIVDKSLLMEIMEAREEVEHASSDNELRPLLQSCKQQQSELCEGLAQSFRERRMEDAKEQTAKLQYWNRLEEAIREKITSVS